VAGADVIIMSDDGVIANITSGIAEINRIGSIIVFSAAGMAGVVIASIIVRCLLKLKLAMGPRNMDLVRQIVFIS